MIGAILKSGNLVGLKAGDPQRTGVILKIIAGEGSFSTWAEVLWSDGSVQILDVCTLSETFEGMKSAR